MRVFRFSKYFRDIETINSNQIYLNISYNIILIHFLIIVLNF